MNKNKINIRRAMIEYGAHSLFVSGENSEKAARNVAKDLLCMSIDAAGNSCGKCKSCCMFDSKSHPDIFILGEGDTSIKVGKVRDGCDWAGMRPTYNSKVILVIKSETMTDQAQNAMLRTLEEPPDSVYFVISGDERRLLQTIRSRITLWMDADTGAELSAEDIKTASVANKHIEQKNWIKLNQLYNSSSDIIELLNAQSIDLRNSALKNFGIKPVGINLDENKSGESKNKYNISLFESEKIIRSILGAMNDIEKSINKNMAIDALVVLISGQV